MADAVETVAAESSPAVVEAPKVDPLQEGPMVTWTREQRNEYRTTGKTPEAPKADPTPAKQSSEAPAESASESETAKQQESTGTQPPHKPKKTAEERIAELEGTIEKIRKGAGLERTQQRAESSTAAPDPKPKPVAISQPQAPKEPAIDDLVPDPDRPGEMKPKWASYEDFIKAQARWEAKQEIAEVLRQQQEEAQKRASDAKLDEARSRYGEEASDIINDLAGEINSDPAIPGVIIAMLRDSECSADLLYVIGSKPEERKTFMHLVKTNPGKAIRYIALTESLIADELASKQSKPAASEHPPAKTQTSAPKPPAEVGGRGSAPPDALLSAAQANDFRSFKAELNRRSLARLKTG